jgi:arabinofuranosyltransferase
MSGRFFTAPFVVALAILARRGLPEGRRARLAVAAAVLSLGAGTPRSPAWSDATYGQADPDRPESWRGIADERAVYYQETGLLPALARGGPPIIHRWAAEGVAARVAGIPFVRRSGIGFYGYFAGRGVHVLDAHALTDPLLARLPASTARGFRIGHFVRPSPEGYEETLRTGENHIADPDLAAYWDVLCRATRGPLLDGERLIAVMDLNLGRYDHLRRAYVERTARLKELRLRQHRSAGPPDPSPPSPGGEP